MSADPPVNAQLREPPTVLTLSFSEPLEQRFSTVRVLDQDGLRVDESVEFDETNDAIMRVHLAELSAGFVTIVWETVSTVDGHRIGGSYPLTILNQDGSLPTGGPLQVGTSVSGTDAEPGRVVGRWLVLVGLAALTGSLIFVIGISPGIPSDFGNEARPQFDRIAIYVALGSVVILAAAAAVEILVQAADLDTSIGTTLDTRWGERWSYRAMALLVSALAVLASLKFWKSAARQLLLRIGLLAALAQMAFLASVSHGAAGEGAFWAAGSDFIHLLAASVWVGLLGLLVVLFVWVRRSLRPEELYSLLASALQRFSLFAVLSLSALLITGTVNSLIELGSFSDLVDSGYGRALAIKLVLLVPLLFVAANNAFLLRPEFVEETEADSHDQESARRLVELEGELRRLIRGELALVLVVLAVVAVLVQLTPTRGRFEAGPSLPGQFIATGEEGGIQFTLVVDPNQPGINTFEVFLTGAVEAVERVRLDISPSDRLEAEARLILDASNPPTFYLGQGPFLSSPGDWQILVDIRRSAGAGTDLSLPVLVQVPDLDPVPTAAPGGDFSSPLTLSPAAAGLLSGSALVALVLLFASKRRPGLPAGYAGIFAEEVSYRLPRFGPVWSLAALTALGFVLGLIVGAHKDEPVSPDVASTGNPIPSSVESIERGRMLFSQNCTQCHGESGRGDGPLASSLPIPPANLYDHIPFHVDQFFFGVITNGLGGIMPSFKETISEEDRWNILNFLRDQFGQPPALQ